MTKLFQRGQFQITIMGGITVVTLIASSIASYYTAQSATKEKINDTKSELRVDISSDRERIAKLEEAIATIKKDNDVIKGDVKEILRILK